MSFDVPVYVYVYTEIPKQKGERKNKPVEDN